MAELPENIVEKVKTNLKISRGISDENDLDFEELENLTVYDMCGDIVRFGSLYADKKCIIVFVRHFLCFACKDYVDDLARIPDKYLKEAGVRLVVIGCAPWKFIKDFRYATQFRHEIFCDPDRYLYSKLGCLERTNPNQSSVSHHVKTGLLLGVFKSFWRSLEYREFQGDMNQQGASVVIGPGEVVHHVHIDQNMADHTPINDLLLTAGVETVNFEGDSRVMHI